MWSLTVLVTSKAPFGICLPGTELLQSLFWTEFIMRWLSPKLLPIPAALSQSLRQSAAMRLAMPIVAQLTKHRKTLLNVVKHYETLVKHCDTLWNTHKISWTTSITSWTTSKTSWNTRHSMRRYRHLMRRYRSSCKVSGDIGAEFLVIAVLV